MTLFWLFIALMVLLALAFVWWPHLKLNTEDALIGRRQLNVSIFKERIQELEEELEEDNLDRDTFQELKGELEQHLLEDVDDEGTRAAKPPKRRGMLTPVILSLGIPLLALTLYLQWGNSDKLSLPKEEVVQSEQGHASSMDEQIAQLRAHLVEQPQDAQGWFTLGRTYITLERYQEAYDAFVQVGAVVGEHAEIIGQQAQALFYLNNNLMTPQIEAMIHRSQELDPMDPGTLGLMGINAYETGQYQQAIEYWQRMLENPQINVNREGLVSAIEQAKQQLAQQGLEYQPVVATAPAAATQPGTGTAASIEVQVELSPELRSQVTDDQVVFIFAQALQGPRMPLAAIKLKVRDLPATVTLDDSMAMGPMMKLSSVDRVQIKATVTKAGTPGTQPGDLVGASGPVVVKEQTGTVRIAIDQVVQ